MFTAALVMMIGKVHEFRTPNTTDLIIWGQFAYTKAELIAAEAQLLHYFEFRVPVWVRLDNIK